MLSNQIVTWCGVMIGNSLQRSVHARSLLAYIVFERDIARFNALYGEYLEIVHRGYSLIAIRYLLSGGLDFRQLLPSASGPFLRMLEAIGSPLARYWSFHQAIVIRKRQ